MGGFQFVVLSLCVTAKFAFEAGAINEKILTNLRNRRSVDVSDLTPGNAGINSHTLLQPSEFTEEMIKAVLAAHNEDRAKEAGANIPRLEWNKTLADMSQAAADQCIFEHLNMKSDADTFVGQNIALFSYDITDKMDIVVDAWYRERENYDLISNSCEEGKACGHYLQMVLSTVTDMGCGYKRCDKITTDNREWNNAYIVFCDYNTIRRRGQKPYKSGAPCSQCKIAPAWKCVNNLCTKCDGGQQNVLGLFNTPEGCTPYNCLTDSANRDRYPRRKCFLFMRLGMCERKRHLMSVACSRTCKICPEWL